MLVIKVKINCVLRGAETQSVIQLNSYYSTRVKTNELKALWSRQLALIINDVTSSTFFCSVENCVFIKLFGLCQSHVIVF